MSSSSSSSSSSSDSSSSSSSSSSSCSDSVLLINLSSESELSSSSESESEAAPESESEAEGAPPPAAADSYVSSSEDDDAAVMHVRKKIRSQPPDVVVSVGSGERKKEFECYRVVLSFASEYFDAMLSSDMKEGAMARIEFPQKDPEEWEIFYDFVSEQKICKLSYDAQAQINGDNVLKLLPWFHEFQMNDLVKQCDACLAKNWSTSSKWRHMHGFWDKDKYTNDSEDERQSHLNERVERFNNALGAMRLADRYCLKSMKRSLEKEMVDLMGMTLATEDLFDLSAINTLLPMVLPLKLDDSKSKLTMMSRCGLKWGRLWWAFEKILKPHIATLSQDIVDNRDTFPFLVYSFKRFEVQLEKEKKKVTAKAEKKIASARKIIKTMVGDYPNDLYRKLPGKQSMGSYGGSQSIASYGRKCLKEVAFRHYLHKKKDFNSLGFTMDSKGIKTAK